MSLVRSSKKRIKHEPCIVLLCRGKTFVPIGESEFPTHLGHPSSNVFFRTDVREGFFKYYSTLTRDPSEWSSELAMGCSKGPENDGFSASLRPFINIEGTNQLYFLTVRHLIKPLSTPDGRLSGVNLVPPFDSDYCVSQVSWNNCRSGVVKVALLNDKIDAALVDPTRAPTTWNSLGIRTNDLDFADKVKRVSDDDGWESDDSCKFDRSIKKVLKSKPWNKHKSKARAKTKRLFKRRGNPAPLLSKFQLPTETVHVMSENDQYHFCQRSPDTEDTPLQSLEEIANSIYSKMDSIVMSNTAKDSDDVFDMEAQKHYKINTEDTPVDDKKEDKEPKWKDCIQNKDAKAARKMLDDDILPGPQELQLAVKTFTYSNEIVKDICQRIEILLQEEHEEIEYIKGCFKHDDPNKDVIFVIKSSKPTTIRSLYPLYVVEQNNIETMKEMECENCTGFQSQELFQKACECLRIKSPDFMEAHSNLTSTSVSPFKLRNLQILEKAVCIVFYVEAKGYIPIGEDVLPEHIKYDENLAFVTDVREGECAIASAGPCDKHEDLKMGCRIVSSKMDAGGTLGCFVNHPTKGLCAITCSHVLLTGIEFGNLYKPIKENQNVESLCTVKCYQPKKPDLCGEICDIRLFGRNGKKCGMDIVLFKVDEERKPKTTAFPDIVAPGVDGVNPTLLNDLLSKQMRYDPRSVMQDSKELLEGRFSQVVKYGMKTKLTSGKYLSSGGSAKFQNKPKKFKYLIADQIVIQDDCGKFAEGGDSGAMVFVIDENKALMALGILTARNDKKKRTYVTPIWNILEEIEMPLPYVLAEPRKAHVIIEELKSSIINNCEALHSILDQ